MRAWRTLAAAGLLALAAGCGAATPEAAVEVGPEPTRAASETSAAQAEVAAQRDAAIRGASATLRSCAAPLEHVEGFARDGGVYLAWFRTAEQARAVSPDCGPERDVADPTTGTLVVDVTDPSRPRGTTVVPIPDGSPVQAVDPAGRVLATALSGFDAAGRGQLAWFDLADLGAPRLGGKLALTTGIRPLDLAYDAVDARLYAAAVQHALIVDTAVPDAPRVLGRISDGMAAFHRVDVVGLGMPQTGDRRFLLVTDITAEDACPVGALHVYDVTGDLRDRPLDIGSSPLPRFAVGRAPPGGCPTATAALADAGATLTVTWRTSEGEALQEDRFPYGTTPQFQAGRSFCTLVRSG